MSAPCWWESRCDFLCVIQAPVVSCCSALSDSAKACGAAALALLAQMKQRDSLAATDDGGLKAALEAIMATAMVSRGATVTHIHRNTHDEF